MYQFSSLLFSSLANFPPFAEQTPKTLLEILVYSVCNRTWFGDTGKTYEMELDKPKNLPFVCHLNFTAAGGTHGDIIQVSTFHNFHKFMNNFNEIFANIIICVSLFLSLSLSTGTTICLNNEIIIP